LNIQSWQFAALLAAAIVSAPGHSASQADFDAKMSHDGLARVNVKGKGARTT
jgi:hypothetical protein